MRTSADGSEPVFTGIAAETINTFNVSPDGKQVAYMTRLAPAHQLWVLENVLAGQ